MADEHIYFAHDRATKTVKIGASHDPEKRVAGLMAGTPLDLVLIRYVQVSPGTMFQVERLIHLKFDPIRVRGEWFQATPEMLLFAREGDVGGAVQQVIGELQPAKKVAGMSLVFLAKEAGISARTIRYYIAQDLLPPPLEVGRNAAYGQAHLDRLNQIAVWKEEGLTLQQIRSRVSPQWLDAVIYAQGWFEYVLADDVKVMVLADQDPKRKLLVEQHLLAFSAGVEK